MGQRSLIVVAALFILGIGFLATSPTLRLVSSFATSTDIGYSVVDKQPRHPSNKSNTTRNTTTHTPAVIPTVLHTSVCQNWTSINREVKYLCSNHFLKLAQERLASGGDVDIVQIGAHVGFEPNDPIAGFLGFFLEKLPQSVRRRFHWTFVEASPPNYKRLQQNMANHSHLCDMKGIHAGVVPDSMNQTQNMIFYSLSDTIDPETGYDSKSNKTLPFFITQLSGFSPKAINDNWMVFRKQGLRMRSYVVRTKVTTMKFSHVIDAAMTDDTQDRRRPGAPLLVLIDTEGFDCNIVQGISTNTLLPPYLVFETKLCRKLLNETFAHLSVLGYSWRGFQENAVGVRSVAEPWS